MGQSLRIRELEDADRNPPRKIRWTKDAAETLGGQIRSVTFRTLVHDLCNGVGGRKYNPDTIDEFLGLRNQEAKRQVQLEKTHREAQQCLAMAQKAIDEREQKKPTAPTARGGRAVPLRVTGTPPSDCANLRQGPNGAFYDCPTRGFQPSNPGVGACSSTGCPSYRASGRKPGDPIPPVGTRPDTPAPTSTGLKFWGSPIAEIIEDGPPGETVDQWMLDRHADGMSSATMAEMLREGAPGITDRDVATRLQILLRQQEEQVRAEGQEKQDGKNDGSTAPKGADTKGAATVAKDGWPEPIGELGSIFGKDSRDRAMIPWRTSAEDVYLKLQEVYGQLPSGIPEPESGETFHTWCKKLKGTLGLITALARLMRVNTLNLNTGTNADTPPQQLGKTGGGEDEPRTDASVAKATRTSEAKSATRTSIWTRPADQVLANIDLPVSWPKPTVDLFAQYAIDIYLNQPEGATTDLARLLLGAGQINSLPSFTVTLRQKVVQSYGKDAKAGSGASPASPKPKPKPTLEIDVSRPAGQFADKIASAEGMGMSLARYLKENLVDGGDYNWQEICAMLDIDESFADELERQIKVCLAAEGSRQKAGGARTPTPKKAPKRRAPTRKDKGKKPAQPKGPPPPPPPPPPKPVETERDLKIARLAEVIGGISKPMAPNGIEVEGLHPQILAEALVLSGWTLEMLIGYQIACGGSAVAGE